MITQDDLLLKIKEAALTAVVQILVFKKQSSTNDRLPRGALEKAVESLATSGVVISKGALKKRVNRSLVPNPNEPPQTVITHGDSQVSSLASHTQCNPNEDGDAGGDDTVDEAIPKAGRPKGSTNASKREKTERYRQCVAAITYEYATTLTANKLANKRTVKGYLNNLIQQKRTEFNVSDEIPNRTIQNRAQRGSLTPQTRGSAPLLLEAAEALIEICIQMGKICQALNVTEGVALMNDIIDGTCHEAALAKFQTTRKLETDTFKYGRVTKGC